MPAAAQDSASAAANTTVIIPLELNKLKDMDFGWVAPPNGGRVDMIYDIDDGAICTTTGGIIRGGTCEAAEFVGVGSFGQRIRITLPAGRRLTLTGPGDDMDVRRLTIYPIDGLERRGTVTAARRRENYDIIRADGGYAFRVGGRLLVGNNQAAGDYEGAFNVVVDYF